jgi:hypothetical protein
MEVDSSFGLQRPDLTRVLLDGPIISVPTGDGQHPIQMTWHLDPPFALPRAGQFAFQVKETICNGGILTFLGSVSNPYPEGAAWETDPLNLRCDGTGCCPDDHGGEFDLIFEVTLCHLSVPARASSWGSVKAIYR